MPTGATIGGDASATASTLTGITGSAGVDDSALAPEASGGLSSGTTSVSETEASSWTARVWGNLRVVLDGADVTSLVGSVSWERSRERAAHYATFTLADPWVSYADQFSYSNGSYPVRIYRYSKSRLDFDETLVFRGRTEAPSNTEPILPTGTFRCVSDSAIWDEPKACFRLNAFGGMTRGEIVQALAASVGLAVEVPPESALVRKPVELMNVPVFEIIRRYGEIEGWYPRGTVDGGIEIRTEQQVWGKIPEYWYDETNSFTVTEEPPSRPPTRYVLSGTTIEKDFSGSETTGTGATVYEEISGGIRDGRAWETRRRLEDSGSGDVISGDDAQIIETIDEYDTFAPLGTVLGVEEFQLKKQTKIRTYFKTYSFKNELGTWSRARTSQQTKRRTTVEEWFSPLAPKDGELWTDGTHHAGTVQAFQTTSETIEEWAWLPSTDEDRPCELDTLTTTVFGYYARATGGATGIWTRDGGGSETYVEDTSAAFDDGNQYSYVAAGGLVAYDLPRISETIETWTVASIGGARSVVKSATAYGMKKTRDEIRGVYDAINNFQYRYGPLEEYGSIGTAVTRWTQSAIPGKHIENGVGLDGSYYSKQVDGEVPDIPRTDGETPSYQQDVMVLDATILTGNYPYNVQAETIPEAEDADELQAIYERRLRMDRALRHTIPAPDNPWVDVWTTIEQTDNVRSVNAWPGPIESIRVSVDILSGAGLAEVVTLLERP